MLVCVNSHNQGAKYFRWLVEAMSFINHQVSFSELFMSSSPKKQRMDEAWQKMVQDLVQEALVKEMHCFQDATAVGRQDGPNTNEGMILSDVSKCMR